MTKPHNWNVLTVEPPGSPAWLKAHEGKLGSTSIAAIVGFPLVKRMSRLRVWGEATGKLPKEDISNLPLVRRGTLLEPTVAALYAKDTGREVMDSPGLIQHPTLPYVVATPDRLVNVNLELAPLELKVVGMHKRRTWNEDVPRSVRAQGFAQAWVMGLNVVSFGGLCLDVEPDEDDGFEPVSGDPLLAWADRVVPGGYFEKMGEMVVQFWEYNVQKDIPPDPDTDVETVKALWPRERRGSDKQLSNEAYDRFMRADALKKDRKLIADELEVHDAALKAEIGDAEYATHPSGLVLRYRVEARKGYSVEPSEPRILRKVKSLGS